MRWNLTVVYFILAGYTLFAQESGNYSLVQGIRAHYGFIIAHSKNVRPVSHSNPFGIEAELAWQLYSDSIWQYCTCYPRTGFSFFYTNFNNPEILGNAYSGYAFIEPLLGAGNKFFATLKFGIGPAYISKVYDSISNPQNRFFGSHISFIVLLNGSLNYSLNPNVSLRLIASFNHISNGGLKRPNSGMNFPTIGIGTEYILKPRTFTKRIKNNCSLVVYKNRLDLMLHATGKTDIKGKAHYPVYGLTASYSRVIGRISALSTGFEFAIDKADQHEIERLQVMNNGKLADNKYLAVLLGHDLLLGRFNFYIQLGAYLYSPFKRMDPVYQRYGLNFYVYKHLILGINIKAHRYEADFLDFRIGYSFW
jgi:hypothetical protein